MARDTLEDSGGVSGAVADWSPNTSYQQYQLVRAPDGSLKRAKNSFTSGATFDATKWDALTSIPSGNINTVDNHVLVQPTGIENGVVVKSPTSTWGADTGAYGTQQAFMVLREGTGSDGVGATGVQPDDTVLFRVNGRGAIGFAGGAHVATGLRARPGDTFQYSLHLNPTYDCTGIYVDSAKLAPISPYQQWRERDTSVVPNTTTVVAEVNPTGQFRANRTAYVTNAVTTNVPLTVQPVTGQTANVQEWRNAAGVTNTFIGSGANLIGTTFVQANTSVGAYTMYNGTSVISVGRTTTDIVHVVKGVAGQTGDLFQAQNSAGVAGVKIDSTAKFLTATGGLLSPALAETAATGAYVTLNAAGTNSGSVVVQGRAAANVPLAVKMAATPTGNAFEIRDSTNTVLHSITPAGRPKWNASSTVQTTVGATGTASAPPAAPQKYLQVIGDDGVTYVLPAYKAS